MSAERAHHTVLEFKHNLHALGAETVVPWVEEARYTPLHRGRVLEAMMLTAWKLETLQADEQDHLRFTNIQKTLKAL